MGIEAVLKDLQIGHEEQGAFLCSAEIFKVLYRMEQRYSVRNGWTGTVVLLSITETSEKLDGVTLANAVQQLLDLLVKSLRLGDVIAKWSACEVVLLLTDVDVSGAEKVVTRLINTFNTAAPGQVELASEYRSIEIHPDYADEWTTF